MTQAALPAQTQRELEQRRRRLEERIASTSALLATSAKDRAAALDRLYGLQRQIVQREELIALTRLQLERVDASLVRTQAVMDDLEGDIATLTAEYGRLARAALRQGLLNHRLAFLLSAGSMNEAFVRVQYLRRYDANRRRQLALIASTRTSLAGKLTRLNELRAEKSALIGEEIEQQTLREGELASKNELIASLSGSERSLKAELEDALKDKAQLDNAIAEVIAAARAAEARRREAREAEARRAREAAAKRARESVEAPRPTAPAAPRAPAMANASDYAAELGGEFAANRGRLPWPVDRGYVSKPFGRQPHPTIARVEINNNGVDIRTDAGAEVRSIFDGEVVGLVPVPGYHTMVVVQHGDYYTVYSNLVGVQVARGSRVGTREVIGSVASGADGASTAELHFEIWRGKAAQSPGAWVKGLK